MIKNLSGSLLLLTVYLLCNCPICYCLSIFRSQSTTRASERKRSTDKLSTMLCLYLGALLALAGKICFYSYLIFPFYQIFHGTVPLL